MKEYFDKAIVDEAIYHARRCYPEEACGFILSDRFLPLPNIAEDKVKNFEIDAREYIRYNGDIKCIVHSHADYGHASKQDMLSQISTNVPWGLICIANGSLEKIAFWGDQLEPQDLVGRVFCHGVHDCYSLVRDYYRMKGITIPIFPRENFWWEKFPSMLMDNCHEAGFEFIDECDLKEGDVVFMQIMANVVNHSAIYLGKSWIVHHLYGKLSKKDPINKWRSSITGYLRYKNA